MATQETARTESEKCVGNVWNTFFQTAGFGVQASEQYASVFKAQEMEIDMIPELSHELLLQMGFTKAGARIKILRLRDVIVARQTGEIIPEAKDVHVPVATFTYGHTSYQLRAIPSVTSGPLVAPIVASDAPSTKPVLIAVNLDKKRNTHGAIAASDVGIYKDPPARPASTSALAASPSHRAEQVLTPIPVGVTEMSAGGGAYSSTAPSSPDLVRRPTPMLANAVAMHGSIADFQNSASESEVAVAEGTYMVNPETGEVLASGGASMVIAAAPLNSASPSSGSSISGLTVVPGAGSFVVRYFMNDEVAKHRVRIQGEASVKSFSSILRLHHKLTADFAVFMFDLAENRLRVLKDSTMVDSAVVYYVLENARIDDLYRKVEKRVKKDLTALGEKSGKTSTWNSENNPLRVDFIPDSELYLGEAGRIGLCMCPGRKKKKTAHEWDRDLEQDLLRIRDDYKCDVVVSLVRRSELVELKIPTLLEDVERMGMESIHFPIKDKWIPDSMADLIRLVDTLVQRLKVGKTLVIHCNGGKGRSGTVAVACMVAMGKRVVQSIDVVRKARSGTIRNPVQIVYVKRFKTAFKNYTKKKQALLETRGNTMGKEDWEALAEQVAQDTVLVEDSDESESELGEGSKRALERARKEEEKALEKARKEEEKTQEKARKEEEKARKEEEKTQEKARKEEEKAAEKARKEEEKTQEKARKEEEKQEKTQEKARKEEEKARREEGKSGQPKKDEDKSKKDEDKSKKDEDKSKKDEDKPSKEDEKSLEKSLEKLPKKTPSDSEPMPRRKNTATATPKSVTHEVAEIPHDTISAHATSQVNTSSATLGSSTVSSNSHLDDSDPHHIKVSSSPESKPKNAKKRPVSSQHQSFDFSSEKAAEGSNEGASPPKKASSVNKQKSGKRAPLATSEDVVAGSE